VPGFRPSQGVPTAQDAAWISADVLAMLHQHLGVDCPAHVLSQHTTPRRKLEREVPAGRGASSRTTTQNSTYTLLASGGKRPSNDEFIERLAIQPNAAERVQIMREELLPWLHEYIPGVAIGATH
jgi:hypothetical protein